MLPPPRIALAITLGLALALAACAGDTGTNTPPPPPPGPTAAAIAIHAGDGQTTTIRTALPSPAAVRVTAANGQAVAGASVRWTVTGGSGSVSAATSVTDAQGVAQTTWTLGPQAGPQTLSAAVTGVAQTPTFTAQATAFYTVLVYMAADNSLSWFGVDDIDEMESVGSSDSVQVVVQAEFSPAATQMEGCGPGCFNRPNYNTFRYRVPRGSARTGPDGPAVDVGNRNMTTAQELADFVAWGKQNYPAQKYVLVLWNHGGGYQGLIEDATSAGNSLMSLATLRAGLLASGTVFEVIDFDMCLMAGAETLLTLDGTTRFVAFSEEVEPGAGDPYDRILARLRANPTLGGGALAAGMVDDYAESYAGTRQSVTKSAVDMARLGGFTTAWNALASELDANLASHRAALGEAVPAAQNYEYPFLRDLGDVLSLLRARTGSATLQGRIDAVQASMSGGLVVRNRHYTGASSQPVGRSTGLHVLLPSGAAADRLPSSGPGSLASYTALYNTPWSAFLAKWLATAGTTQYFDQGANQLQAAVVWDTAAVSRATDIDMWVIEPNGTVYIPYLGAVTPNGTFSGDSWATNTWYEIYSTRRFVEVGRYRFLAELYADPQDFRPRTTFLYRQSSGAGWTDLYGASAPRLSKARRWTDDSTPTLGEITAGAYTDLVLLAYWDVVASAAGSAVRGGAGAPRPTRGAGAAEAGAELTAAQWERIAQLLGDPAVRASRDAARARLHARGRGALPALPLDEAAGRDYAAAAARGRP